MSLQKAELKTPFLEYDSGEGVINYQNQTTNPAKINIPEQLVVLEEGSIALKHLAPFLNVKDKARLARTSTTLLKFILTAEKNAEKAEFKRNTIRPPGPHALRYKYRKQWGSFFDVCPCPQAHLVASEDHEQTSVAFPVLSPDGESFLNLRGIKGENGCTEADSRQKECEPSSESIYFLLRLFFASLRAPYSSIQCTAILAGCAYGSYLDSRFKKKTAHLELEKLVIKKKSPLGLPAQTALEWADACNPCGSQPSHPASYSLIAPPSPAKSDWKQAICVTNQGDCVIAESCCLLMMPQVLPMTISLGVMASPCIISSCIGYAYGYGLGILKQRQLIAHPLDLDKDAGPRKQGMN